MPTLIVTDVGRTAYLNAKQAGLPYNIVTAKLGTGQYVPTSGATDLVTPFNPAKEFDWQVRATSDDSIATTFQDEDTGLGYSVGEIGFYDQNDVLYAIFSQVSAEGFIFSKTAGASVAIVLLETDLDATVPSVTFTAPATTFALATENTFGIVRYGTEAEITAGTLATRAVSALGLRRWWDALAIPVSKLTGTIAAARLPTISIAKGGTGATTAAQARTNLGVGFATTLVGSQNVNIATAHQFVDSGIDRPTSVPTWGLVGVGDASAAGGAQTSAHDFAWFRWADLPTSVTGTINASNTGLQFPIDDQTVGYLAVDSSGNILFGTNQNLADPMPLAIYSVNE